MRIAEVYGGLANWVHEKRRMSAENPGLQRYGGELISCGMLFARFAVFREQFANKHITGKMKLVFSKKWRISASLSSCGVFFQS